MNLALRPRIIAALLGLVAFLPASLIADMTPAAVKSFEETRAEAEKGIAWAQSGLGIRYALGVGVAKDEVAAVRWYRKAAEQGLAHAQFNLGLHYVYGQGVAKDEIEAYAYWNLSGITYEPARNKLAILEREMSPDARLLGQRRTKQLQKEIEGRLESAEEIRKAIEKERIKGA